MRPSKSKKRRGPKPSDSSAGGDVSRGPKPSDSSPGGDVSRGPKPSDSSAGGDVSPPHAEHSKPKTKKDPVKFDRGQEDLILDFMEGNECLWNPRHGEWMKQDVKEKAWNMIGAILQCDGSDVRTWLNTNKDRYIWEHKNSKSGSGSKILSARMEWLMTHFSFYSKVVTHHQKPVVSVRHA